PYFEKPVTCGDAHWRCPIIGASSLRYVGEARCLTVPSNMGRHRTLSGISANVRVVMLVRALRAQGFSKLLLEIVIEIKSGAEFGQPSDMSWFSEAINLAWMRPKCLAVGTAAIVEVCDPGEPAG